VFEPKRRGRRYLLSFQDLVVLRAAKDLLDARVPAARVQRALAALARELPPERPLSGLRIYADGRDVAVCNGETAWQPETGQLVLDFELDSLAKLVDDARRARRPVREAAGAGARARAEFERALDLEDEAPAEAALAYRRAVALDPDLVDAWVNLGRLVHDAGDAAQAVVLYREAAARSPGDPIVHFNLALALEDTEGPAAAAAAYEAALALDPDFADAHFNLAGLCEQQGRPADALRHYSAYKRLTKG
jgi:tetratricopeptide (TPR) repeat protein